MEKIFKKKYLFLLNLLLVSFFCNAQIGADSVIMTVAGKEVSLAEFEYMAAKNNEVDLNNKKSLNDYLELFKIFKLKVADAEDAGFDKKTSFINEYAKYKAELTNSYMSDPKGEEAAVRLIYDRGNNVLDLSYILFRFPGKVVSKDTVAIYENAFDAYRRILKGEDFDEVAESLKKDDPNSDKVYSGRVNSFLPLKGQKAFDNAAYSLAEGEVSKPVRTSYGYYIIKLSEKKPNLGRIKVAHILFKADEGRDVESDDSLLNESEKVRERILAGEDFYEMAKEFSKDPESAKKGGVMPFFSQGMMVPDFEKAAFELTEIGEVSKPVKTQFGYHLIKLIDKKPRPTFEEVKESIASVLKKDEWNFEFYNAFDSRLKKEYNYTFYPKAYAELQKVCDSYFPTDSMFFKSVENMKDTLLVINNQALTQRDFSYYLLRCPFSTKTYSGDFMQEVYDLYLRDIVTTFERENLEKKYPEYSHLLQEYRDGILLFEISDARVWQHPVEDQPELEKLWVQEIQKKYPVTINTKLLKKIKKH
ncbi:peptidylprolyl isomerase [Massilibacteroides sp.]|uniref:peptidylprolyl isomerase n=1 Tax=Massilibacteroides sp. TaxID=2034766 RepID=UPI0026321BBD|nr:peptidylprolyl isomerase [Massilibacteroides sp.]MDD4514909.1 peptidylprolyl isomerase [Massilibacteroides sp.]